jgi:uncharacterized protein YjbI with pentapeptide repeats
MASEEHLQILQQGVTAWNEWRAKNPEVLHSHLSGVNLHGADLTGAHLAGANLTGAELSLANLERADLRGADLTGADLNGTQLIRADLSDADLTECSIYGTDCRYATGESNNYSSWSGRYRQHQGCSIHLPAS